MFPSGLLQVKGPILDNDERIMLTGQAPRLGRNCRANESYTSNLEFRRLKPNDGAQSQQQFTAVKAPRVEESKSEVPSTAGSELPSTPTAQPPATPQGASVYIAGRVSTAKRLRCAAISIVSMRA